jgi:hypothetical protein
VRPRGNTRSNPVRDLNPVEEARPVQRFKRAVHRQAVTLELQLDEGDLNRAVRDVWMNVLHAVNRARSARRFRTGYEVSMK